jgi:alpha-amylase
LLSVVPIALASGCNSSAGGGGAARSSATSSSSTRSGPASGTTTVGSTGATSSTSTGIAPAAGGVMMQAFYEGCPSSSGAWWWDNLESQASEWGSKGFTAAWLPCVLKAASGGVSLGYDPFDDYDIGSKNQRGTIPTHFGPRQNLEKLCAVLHANGIQVYEDMVDSHRDGDPGNYSFTYVGAYGTAGAGRFPKSAGDFYPQAPMDGSIPDQVDTPDGRWIMPTTDLASLTVNGATWSYSDYGMKQSGDWLTKALGCDGYRIDDVKASSPSWLASFLSYGSMSGKFAVGEYYDGDVSDVNGWITDPNGINGAASAFDFPLKFNYLNPMCNDPGSFDMSSLDGAGLIGVNPTKAVTFVEDHDTDQSAPITQNKIMAYALILTAEGYPCVFYKDWSTDPGCYGSGLQAAINDLIWIHGKIANGTTQQRWENNQIYVFERMGGSHLLVGLNADGSSSHTITCATGFGPSVSLHDYTSHAPDVTTDGSGNATITIPINSNGTGYVAYSVQGIAGGFSPPQSGIVQEYAGATDLDILPADDTQQVTAATIYVQAGKPLSGALYYDTAGWTSATSITLELSDPSGTLAGQATYTSATAQGSTLSVTPTVSGDYSFKLEAHGTPSSNPKPAYWLDTTYTAPTK